MFGNTGFVIDLPEGLIKKNVLPGKTVQRKQLLLGKTYFHKLQLDIKISKKKSVQASNIHKLIFCSKWVCLFLLIQFIARAILIYVLHCIFCIWLEKKKFHKKVIKAKWRKGKHPFVDKNSFMISPNFKKIEAT